MLFSTLEPSWTKAKVPGGWKRGVALNCVLVVTLCWSRSAVSQPDYTITRVVESTTTPSPTATLSPSSSSSSSSSSPSPTPIITPFLEYVLADKLFIKIVELELFIYTQEEGYYNLTVDDYPELMSLPSNVTIGVGSDTLNLTKSYQYNGNAGTNSTFVFSFILTREPTTTDQMWYISKFTHRNHTTDSNTSSTTCSFHYSGMSAIHSPSDLTYHCSDIQFQGDCVCDIMSEASFKGLSIQAFQLNNKTPSSTYVDCAAKSHNNSIIDLVVGTVVGTTIGIALLIIIGTIVIKKVGRKVRWRGYNLLDD